MRPSSALLLSSAALLCQHQQTATALTIPTIPNAKNPYHRDRDLSSLLSGSLDVLDRVPGLADKIVNTTLLVVRALRETVADNGITQNDLDLALGINGTTGMPLLGNTTRAVTCPDVAVLYARGTNEPGNVGFLTGPPFFDALRTYMNGTGSIAIQGVNSYPAQPAGFFAGGSATGAAFAAQVASRTLASCPDTRLTVSGYSQGSQVARLAVAQMPPDQRARLSSVVLFGDPLGGKAIDGVDPTKLLVICHTGDNICQGGDFIFNTHLDYSLDAPTAALFVMQRSGLGLASRDAQNEGMGDTMVGTVQGIMHSSKGGIASD
ncbi:cutinase [Colletotrichum orchidophilum]|uniref:Cutinase n=1 Tax=Colletotrichum orchidophilum TaxID=1209926 RepID=A0A1G4BJ60_9PEZI|nr:cutinase [Colletotrichum orchidophilum]OHF01479.1 cutinase [Colletotrichum orchidophilum]